jgi:phosphohistidine swiveling domain-containing protein
VRLARAGSGLREHPKFLLVRLLGAVREAFREAGRQLVGRGSLARADDVYLFTSRELISALEAPQPPDLRVAVAERRARLEADARRAPPFMVASDGEIAMLEARADIPENCLSGTAASSGVVEGPGRVVLDPAREVLQRGEILVAPFTDPGWTPLFVHAAGLVTEVGGLMTHGSVVAREYGIPAVVSVTDATRRIVTGQRSLAPVRRSCQASFEADASGTK